MNYFYIGTIKQIFLKMKRCVDEVEFDEDGLNIDREWRPVKPKELVNLTEKRSWCQARINSFLHQTKFVEILSKQFKLISDGLSEDILKMGEELGFVVTSKCWLFADNLEAWYNYFIGARDEIELAKLGIIVRRHHVKDHCVKGSIRGIFNRSDIRQDDFETVVLDCEPTWRTDREMTKAIVKTDVAGFPTHERPLTALHVSEVLMRRLMEYPGLIPDPHREKLKSAFSRLNDADSELWSSMRHVVHSMVRCQMASKKINPDARIGGFAFDMHWMSGNMKTDMESFHFQIGDHNSINNPQLSRQMGVDETFKANIQYEHELYLELSDYRGMQREASEWLADHNGVSYPNEHQLSADENLGEKRREYK